jgi:pimeloyl-ACP methyl ester carboxylesterase
MRTSLYARRRILESAVAAVITPKLVAAQATARPVPLAGPEVEEFKAAQNRLLATFAVRAQSRFLKLTDPATTAHVLDAGTGPPVIMLAGGATVSIFAPMMGPLSNQFRTIAVDRPGCGLSERFDYQGTSFRELGVRYIERVLDSLKLEKVSVIGNSIGGFWSLAFALARPNRVNKLVLIGEVAGSAPDQGKARATAPKPPTTQAVKATPSIERTRTALATRMVVDIDRVHPEIIEVLHAASLMPGIGSSSATMMKQITQEGFQLTYSLRPELRDFHVPTLFLWGDQDKLGPPQLGREMAAVAPNARCEIIASAGHIPWLDQPEQCIQLTSGFLKVEGIL